MDYSEQINNYFNRIKQAIDNVNKGSISNFISLMKDASKQQRKIYIFGNGGSASTASHFACDFNKGLKSMGFNVESLCDNVATLLAIANDINYEDIFSEQLKGKITDNDIVIGISGSGNSKNVIKALQLANSIGADTVGITGYNGGEIAKMVTLSVNFPILDMQISEDCHLILNHMTMQILKEEMK